MADNTCCDPQPVRGGGGGGGGPIVLNGDVIGPSNANTLAPVIPTPVEWTAKETFDALPVAIQLGPDVPTGSAYAIRGSDSASTALAGTSVALDGGAGAPAVGAAAGSNGGFVQITGGAPGAAGAGATAGIAGGVDITGAAGAAAVGLHSGSAGGDATVKGGVGGAASANSAARRGGEAALWGGDGGAGSAINAGGTGGAAEVLGGNGADDAGGGAGAGGSINVIAGDAGADLGGGGAQGGSVVIAAGGGSGAGAGGSVGVVAGDGVAGVGGDATLDAGNGAVAGSVLVGTANARTVQIARAGVETAVGGTLGVGGSPGASARFAVVSTTQGAVSVPVMTTAQKTAIAAPAAGLQVFDSTLERPSFYDSAAWQTVGLAPVGATITTDENAFPVGAYGDLATVGPTFSVTLGVATTVRITFSAIVYNATGIGFTALMSIALSGATVLAANNANCIGQSSAGAGFVATPCRDIFLALNAGTTTITMKYQRDNVAQDWHAQNRTVAAAA